MLRESEQAIRAQLLTLTDEELEDVLSPRELEALRQGYRERVTDMHLPTIAELPVTLPTLFSQAATRAQAAGFDGVELHYAHAYTMASFIRNEHPGRWIWRWPGTARAVAPRSLCGGAGGGRR